MAAGRKPHLWMFAGPNGSGKSTFYKDAKFLEDEEAFWIINPDLLTSDIAEREELDWLPANGVALDRIMTWLEASVAMYRPVGFETVLSSDKYFDFIDRALARGFELHLIYVALRAPELNIERVRKRVAEGGHGVTKQRYWPADSAPSPTWNAYFPRRCSPRCGTIPAPNRSFFSRSRATPP